MTPARMIICCYSQYQPLYDRLKREIQNIEFHSGIPNIIQDYYFLNTRVNNLIVFDELMTEVKNDTVIVDIFSRGRHNNTSVILLLQTLFPQGRPATDIVLNSQYLILFDNHIDRHQILLLARRIYQKLTYKLTKAYETAISIPYGFIYILKSHYSRTPKTDRQSIERK